jgi:hypothetical protein
MEQTEDILQLRKLAKSYSIDHSRYRQGKIRRKVQENLEEVLEKYGSQADVVILDPQATMDEDTEDQMDASQVVQEEEWPLPEEEEWPLQVDDIEDMNFNERTLYPSDHFDDSSDDEEDANTGYSSDSSGSSGSEDSNSKEKAESLDDLQFASVVMNAELLYDDITGAIKPYPGTSDDGYSDYYELEREKKPQKKQYEGPIPTNRPKKRYPYTDDNCQAPDIKDITDVEGLKKTLKEMLVFKNSGSTVEQLMKLLIHLQVVYKLPTAAMTGVMNLLHSLHPGLNFPKAYPLFSIYASLQVRIQHNRELRIGVQIKEHHLRFVWALPGDNGEMLRQQGVSVRTMPALQMSLL